MTPKRIIATVVAALTLAAPLSLSSSGPAGAAPAKDPVIVVAGFLVGPAFGAI